MTVGPAKPGAPAQVSDAGDPPVATGDAGASTAAAQTTTLAAPEPDREAAALIRSESTPTVELPSRPVAKATAQKPHGFDPRPTEEIPKLAIDWQALGESDGAFSRERAAAMAWLSRVAYADFGTQPEHARDGIYAELEKQGFSISFLEGPREKQTIYDDDGKATGERDIDPSTQGLLLTRGDDAFVIFRGTETTSPADRRVISRFDTVATDQGAVHAGFNRGLDQVWEPLREQLTALRAQNPNVRLHLGGHSLGGALATLTATRLEAGGTPVADLYVYGSPRVGNLAFREHVATSGLNQRMFRFETAGDNVVALPPASLGFDHCGQQLAYPDGGHGINNYVEWCRLKHEPAVEVDVAADVAACVCERMGGLVCDEGDRAATGRLLAATNDTTAVAHVLPEGMAAQLLDEIPAIDDDCRTALSDRMLADRIVHHGTTPGLLAKMIGSRGEVRSAENRREVVTALAERPPERARNVLRAVPPKRLREFRDRLRKDGDTDAAATLKASLDGAQPSARG